MEWQFSPNWYKLWTWWPWWRQHYDLDYDLYYNYAGIGPLQFRWYSRLTRK